MASKRRKIPKISAADIQKVLHELDAWCRQERLGRLGWKVLEDLSGFTRQALSSHAEIANRYGEAKAINRAGARVDAPRPKTADQRIVDLQREIERLKGIVNRYDERWARYARNAALRGINLELLDEPMTAPARANVRVFKSKGRRANSV